MFPIPDFSHKGYYNVIFWLHIALLIMYILGNRAYNDFTFQYHSRCFYITSLLLCTDIVTFCEGLIYNIGKKKDRQIDTMD